MIPFTAAANAKMRARANNRRLKGGGIAKADAEDRVISANCAPPPRTTYLAIGQDVMSIFDHVEAQYNVTLHRDIEGKESYESKIASEDNHQRRGLKGSARYVETKCYTVLLIMLLYVITICECVYIHSYSSAY
jgi:hypothetical protein